MPEHFTYILQCADGSYYVGCTSDVPSRVAAHNDGEGGLYTSTRRPVKLVYSERHVSVLAARSREQQLKRWSTAKKAALARGDLERVHKLARRKNRKVKNPRV